MTVPLKVRRESWRLEIISNGWSKMIPFGWSTKHIRDKLMLIQKLKILRTSSLHILFQIHIRHLRKIKNLKIIFPIMLSCRAEVVRNKLNCNQSLTPKEFLKWKLLQNRKKVFITLHCKKYLKRGDGRVGKIINNNISSMSILRRCANSGTTKWSGPKKKFSSSLKTQS